MKLAGYLSIQNQLPTESTEEYELRVLAVALGLSIERVRSIPSKQTFNLKERMAKIEFEPQKMRGDIKVGKVWYKVDWNLTDITAGQYIDLSAFAVSEANIHKSLACLLRPCKFYKWFPSKYSGAKHPAISEHLLDNMTIEQARPLMVFFCTLLQESVEATQTYLESQMKELETLLHKNGDGSQQ